MEDCEANCVVIRSLLGSCLSNINKNMPLWRYDILLPEEEEDCSISYLLNLTIDELKKILELCGLITINNNIVKFVRSPSGYRGKYSWSVFFKIIHYQIIISLEWIFQDIIRDIKKIFVSLVLVLKVIQ